MSTALLDAVVKKNRVRLIPFMLALYVLAFLDRSNIGFAKQTYQIDTGLSNEAYALGAGIFFVVYAFLGVPANLGNDSNLLIVFYVQIMPDDFVMQLHRF
ncbi:transporter [Shigella dysenteriae]|nr:transporter [Shigella dysenteriae]